MEIGGYRIASDRPVFVIAELSANHNQRKNLAIETIRAAKAAGADAVKLQTYTPETLTIDCANDYFKISQGTLWDGKTLYQLYKEAYTPWEWHKDLFDVAHDEGLICFSSPFDKTAVDFLEDLDCPAYKIASFEIKDLQLIEYVASKGKPIIISTGIADKEDIELALHTCRNVGNSQIVLLKCTSSYPAPLELANLSTMADMKTHFGVEVGLSDHTPGSMVPVVATALGARVIEKHFIIDRKIGGPDSEFSLDRSEFQQMVDNVRTTEKVLGRVTYEVPDKVKGNIKFARSLFAVRDIEAGEVFTLENIRSIRPGYGMHPKYLGSILNKKAKEKIQRGTPLDFSLIEGISN